MAFLKWISLSAWTCSVLAAPYSTPRSYNGTAPTAQIKNGTVEGVHSAEYNQDYFLGVPYAQPPVGTLRFRPAQAMNTSWTGPLSAKAYSPSCAGYGSDNWPYALAEDCLYLNVVRPSGYENEKLPVAFWLHGGGLYQGSGIDERYNLSFIVQRGVDIGKPFIGITINYRLSMWGFINGEEVVESGNTNLGYKDQRLAMHWVQDNIAAFGGDPDKVTIWGESAGALSVGFHLTAYGGRDDSLFRAAILQSGNPISYNTLNYNPNNLLNASTQLGCGAAPSKLDCLRGLDFNTIHTWINSTAGRSLAWNPIIDSDFIREKTSLQLASGAFVHVPIIDGANSDEGSVFGPRPLNTSAQFFSALTNSVTLGVTLTSDQATKVFAAYPANLTYGAVPTALPASYVPPPALGPASRQAAAYYGDAYFIAGRRKTCQTWSANSVPAYCYRFNTIHNGLTPESSAARGATHFQEVAFVFNNQLGVGYGYPNVSAKPFENVPQANFALAEQMSATWARFVTDLTPGEWWPKYEVGEEGVGENWVFDAKVEGLGYVERDDFRLEGIELLNSWNADVFGR